MWTSDSGIHGGMLEGVIHEYESVMEGSWKDMEDLWAGV